MAELRTWQKDAFEHFNKSKVMMAEVCTGAGKTFFAVSVMKEILKKNPDYRILIVVPKLVILNGWLKELYPFFDITDIAYFNGEMKEYSKITLTTTASLSNIVLDLFDVIIADEAHNFYSKRLLGILALEHWKYKLALSATLYSKNFNHLKLEKLFNFNKYKYGIKEALDDGVLNKFEWYNHEVELDDITKAEYTNLAVDIKQTLGSCGGFDGYIRLPQTDPRRAKLNKLFDLRNKLIFNYENKFNSLIEICKENINRKIIIFNQYNLIGTKILSTLRTLGIDARIVNSQIDEREKQKRIKDYNDDKFNVLITTKMFDEGYNLPSIDTAIIFSGDSTARQTTQRVGRVLRLKDYNSKIYQIYCKDTFESKSADSRTEMFKPLAEKFGKVEW